MGKRRNQRNGRILSRASATVPGANKFAAPTSGLEILLFTRGSTRDAARFMDTVDQLARHVGTWIWYQLIVAAKAMIELVKPVSLEPTKPIRKYYTVVPDGGNATTLITQTNDRFGVGNLL